MTKVSKTYLGLSRDSAAPLPDRWAGGPTLELGPVRPDPSNGCPSVGKLFVDLSPNPLVDRSRNAVGVSSGRRSASASRAAAALVGRASEEATGSSPGSTLTASRTGEPRVWL